MKFRTITLVLILSVLALAQNTSQTTPQQTEPTSAKAGCACCDKADAKEAHSCCTHHDMTAKDGKEATSRDAKDDKSCCNGKDGMSCKRADKDKTAASCGNCMKNHEKDCCATAKGGDKTGMSCCKDHCSAHASAKASS